MGTAIVGLVMAVIVAAILFSLFRNKKKGKSSCCGDCAHCASHKADGSSGSNGSRSTILEVEGMMCGMCESHVNDAIRNNFYVKSVKSSHKTGIVQIISEEPLDKEKLSGVIQEMGYTLKNVSEN